MYYLPPPRPTVDDQLRLARTVLRGRSLNLAEGMQDNENVQKDFDIHPKY